LHAVAKFHLEKDVGCECASTFAEPKNVIGTLVSKGQVVSSPDGDPGQSAAALGVYALPLPFSGKAGHDRE
jgi:hypothetical protein